MKHKAFFPIAAMTLSLGLLPMMAPASEPIAEPAVADGENVFRQQCQNCHSIEPGKPSPLGPSLAGVFGREAGMAKYRYSPALRNSGLTWTREELDAYLAAPSKAVPGTRMVVGLSGEEQRAAVIAYLEQAASPDDLETTQD